MERKPIFDVVELNSQLEKGYSAIDLKLLIQNFTEQLKIKQNYLLLAGGANNKHLFKENVLTYKEIQVILLKCINSMQNELKMGLQSYDEIKILLFSENHIITPQKKTEIIKNKIELSFLPKRENPSVILFFELYLLLITVINNLGVVYFQQGKILKAECILSKALLCRLSELDSRDDLLQLTILMSNFSYLKIKKQDVEEACEYINKGTFLLESLDIALFSNYTFNLNLNDIFSLLKLNQKVISDPRNFQIEQVFHLQALNYHFYGSYLQRKDQQKESDFCKVQFEFYSKEFFKINSKSHYLEQNEKKNDEQIIPKEQIEVKFLKTTVNQSQNFSQVNVSNGLLYQSYILIGSNRYKISFIRDETHIEILQIVIYSKPLDQLCVLYVKAKDIVTNKNLYKSTIWSIQEDIKRFIKKLQIKNNQFQFSGVTSYNRPEDFEE